MAEVIEPAIAVIDPDGYIVSVHFDDEEADSECEDLNSYDTGYRVVPCSISWIDRE